MPGLDDQDQSEVFDEDNADISETGGATREAASFGEIPDVLDVTSADGDADDDDGIDSDLEDTLGASGVEVEADAQYGGEGARLAEIDLGADTGGESEIELVYAGLMENVKGAQASAAHWEAKTLSDEDIEELGYGPEGDDQ